MLDNYFLSKEELQEKYLQANVEANHFTETGGVFPNDWLLKLLKMRASSAILDKALKARANNFILKTFA